MPYRLPWSSANSTAVTPMAYRVPRLSQADSTKPRNSSSSQTAGIAASVSMEVSSSASLRATGAPLRPRRPSASSPAAQAAESRLAT